MKFDEDFEERDQQKNSDKIYTLSCDTLNDTMSSAPLIEDVSIFCDICKEFIYYGEINMHRKLHKSFSLLQINDFTGVNFKNLVKRRNKIIKHLKTCSSDERENVLPKVDEAYTIIYNYLITENHQEIQLNHLASKDNIPYKYGPASNIFNHTKTGSLSSEIAPTFNIGFGINSQLKDQEPSIIVEKISDNHECFVTVTGVDGHCAKKFVSEKILLCLTENFISQDQESHNINNLSNIIQDTLLQLDKSLSTGLYDNVTYKSWSGCCLEMVVVSKESEDSYKLTVTNVGDGSVILVTKEGHQLLSILHSMKNDDEVKRVESLGGSNLVINGECFLCGTTQTTQLLGGYGNNRSKQFQLPVSQSSTHKLNLENDLGLVMINREISRLIPVKDVVEIFKSEITGSLAMLPESSDDIYGELLDCNHDDYTPKVPANDTKNNFKERKYLGNIETKSRIIARKVINAGALSSNYSSDLGVVVILFNEKNSLK